jgi:hypothetical protein
MNIPGHRTTLNIVDGEAYRRIMSGMAPVMIERTISCIIVRVSRRSSTGNAAARPDTRPALSASLGASPKYRDGAARVEPINQTGALNHTNTVPQRHPSNHRAVGKSP